MATAKEKLIASAQKLVEKGAFEKAIKEYLRVVQEDSADVRIWLKIGDLYAKIGKKPEATDTYQRVAQFYSDQGFYLKSVAVYKQILKLEPRLVDVNTRLAELYKQLGLISDAISQYEQVAAFFHKDGKVKEALAAMKQIVDLDPETVASRIKLAEMYSREQMPHEAIVEFTHAAKQLHEQGRLDEYMKVAERLLFHSPDNKAVTRELARLYIDKSDPRRALPKLQVLFKADPRDLDVLRLLARAFEGLEQRPKAVSVYKELARILHDTGDARAATEVFRQILAIQPDDAEASAALRGVPPAPKTPPAAPPQPGRRPTLPPPLTSSAPLRAHATGAERALDSGGHRAMNAGNSGANEVPAPDAPADVVSEEIAKILGETDVYIKYNLHAKAIDHLQRVFERQPRHVAAREKLKALYITVGRKDDAIKELWALSENAEQGRARRYVREIYELDPSNARAAKVLGEVVRSGNPVASTELEPEDDYGVSMPTDFGLPSSAPRRDAPAAESRLGDIELADDSDGVSFDEEPLSEADLDLDEDPEGDDDLIPVVIDTGSDPSERAIPVLDDEDRFSLDDAEPDSLPVATGYETSSPDAQTNFGTGPRGVAATPPSDDELSFAELDGPEDRTGVMTADEMSAFDDPSPQRTAFQPVDTALSALTPLELAEHEHEHEHEHDQELVPPPSETGSRRTVPVEPLRSESNLEDDLDESDFFMQQSLFEEARSMLGSLLDRYPNHPLVMAKVRELEGLEAQSPPVESAGQIHAVVGTNTAEVALPPSEPMRPMSSINALSAQLPTGVPGDEDASHAMGGVAASTGQGVEVTRRGVIERGVSAEDFETHYDLGIAYKEMGLIDDAIAEFRIVMRDTKREVQCQLMIGLCYLEKEMFTEAINQFKKGLYVEEITDPEALSLYYELGQAYEKIGDPREALYYYDKVQKREPQFRDLARRLRALRGEASVVTAAPVSRGGGDEVDDAFDSLLDES
ncbi:MAG: tetratricopeptide repeat protein [Polyangia bacterium]